MDRRHPPAKLRSVWCFAETSDRSAPTDVRRLPRRAMASQRSADIFVCRSAGFQTCRAVGESRPSGTAFGLDRCPSNPSAHPSFSVLSGSSVVQTEGTRIKEYHHRERRGHREPLYFNGVRVRLLGGRSPWVVRRTAQRWDALLQVPNRFGDHHLSRSGCTWVTLLMSRRAVQIRFVPQRRSPWAVRRTSGTPIFPPLAAQ